MNFPEAEKYLLSLGNEVAVMKLGLETISRLLVELGRPATKIPKVQIAGTNGKGSVCTFLNSICLEAGIRTGLYTSPHLISMTERIKIDGKNIGEDEFVRITSFVRDTSESLVRQGVFGTVPTYFEQVTAIALIAFANHDSQLIILETGLGGRLDATTAANAEIAAITRIDYDHQQYLGETIEEIAAEKAAIIGDHTKSVVIGEQVPEVMSILKARCDEFGVIPLTECESWILEVNTTQGSVAAGFRTNTDLYDDVDLGLAGRHQLENARVAVMIADLLRTDQFPQISVDAVLDGLENARHPGRLEYIGNMLLDGAHNPGGAKALKEYLDEFVTQPIVMIFGAMSDKNVAEISEILFPKAETVILTHIDNSRAISLEVLHEVASKNIADSRIIAAENVEKALSIAKQLAGTDKLILVTGSLYLVGEVKKILQTAPSI